MSFKPQRRWRVEIVAEGDTWWDAVATARELAEHARRAKAETKADMARGGGHCSGHVIFKEDPEMTHERYHRELDAYLEAQDAAESAPAGGNEHG